MEHLDTANLDKPLKKPKKVETVEVYVVPRFIFWIVGILLVGNILLGSIIFGHKELMTEHWRSKIHDMTKPSEVKAETTPSPTPKGADIVIVSDKDTKGGCDTRYNQLTEDGCYPYAK